METEAAFLRAIAGSPADPTAWLVLADWLEENGQPERAELLRLRQDLLRELRAPDRPAREARLQELIASGVRPPVPQVVNSLGMRLALIPPGRFLMGSPRGEDERDDDEGPVHEVEITRGCYLGIFPVTQGQYKRVVGTNPSSYPRQPPAELHGAGRYPCTTRPPEVKWRDLARFPVETVSWNDAVEFCRRLSERPAEKEAGRVYRLPTEAQWEYACRAGTTTAFAFGPSLSSTQANFEGNYPYGGADKGPYLGRSCAVGSYRPNAWGLYDMHGNIWEWCADWYSRNYYKRSPRKDPKGPPTGTARVLRGGDWDSYPLLCRAAVRGHNVVDGRYPYNGFRVLLLIGEDRS
jgi:uncharacterized protein (TIGR02996 family)